LTEFTVINSALREPYSRIGVQVEALLAAQDVVGVGSLRVCSGSPISSSGVSLGGIPGKLYDQPGYQLKTPILTGLAL
jgi:hypothetical protein